MEALAFDQAAVDDAPISGGSLTIPLDRSIVLVRAGLPTVTAALAAYSSDPAHDVTDALARGAGLDEVLPAEGTRALAFRRRGAGYVGIIREGEPGQVHDVPLARRLSRLLGCPAVALHLSGADVALELFHAGRSIESWLVVSGQVVSATSAFADPGADVAQDPYGRALAVLHAYGFEDDRLSFRDFAKGDVVFRRWDVTLARCQAFADLGLFPKDAFITV